MSFDSTKAPAAAKREVKLCRRMLAKGSPAPFWRHRLITAALQLSEAAEILANQVDEMDQRAAAVKR